MRATTEEIVELTEILPPIARLVVERRWLVGDGARPRLAEIAEETGTPLLTLDRQEAKAYRMLVAELGEVPHPVYEPEIAEAELERHAARVRDGEERHTDVAKALRICTSRVRVLLGPRTRMMNGRMVHGARAFFEHECRCEVCRASVAEALHHYDAGGDARADLEPLDMAPCQESPRVYFAAGHHEAGPVLEFCARVGIDVDAVRQCWWRKQRGRLWWSPGRLPKCNPVTVAAKRFPEMAPRSARADTWVRRWLSGDVEEEVLAEGVAPGRHGYIIADIGWCDAEGFPTPTKQATHFGVEWSRMQAP